jgi:hypothetical protein
VSARPQLAQSKAVASNKNRTINNNTLRDRGKTPLLMRRSLQVRVAHASRVLAMTSRHRGLLQKIVPARRRNQHARHVRYPDTAATLGRRATLAQQNTAAKFSVSFGFFMVKFTAR